MRKKISEERSYQETGDVFNPFAPTVLNRARLTKILILI